MHIKKGASEPFLHEQTSVQDYGLMGSIFRIFVTMRSSIKAISASNVLMGILPCVILAKLETGDTVEVGSVEKCSLTQHPAIS